MYKSLLRMILRLDSIDWGEVIFVMFILLLFSVLVGLLAEAILYDGTHGPFEHRYGHAYLVGNSFCFGVFLVFKGIKKLPELARRELEKLEEKDQPKISKDIFLKQAEREVEAMLSSD